MTRIFEISWKLQGQPAQVQEFSNCEDEMDAIFEWDDMWNTNPDEVEYVNVKELENES
jgi:hypothetical protein